MLNLVEMGNCHKTNGGDFEMCPDKGGRLESLHWSNSFSDSFIHSYSDFLLIDITHKTSIYDLSLVVTTVVDYLSISIPVGF